MNIIETGWERNKRVIFDEIVENYDRIRPEYPKELFNDIFQCCKFTQGQKAIEIGAGTGKATTPFLKAGYEIDAVEIGSNMTDFLRKRFGIYKGFHVVHSSFEDVVLQENSYDLIYAASAFHWVDADVGCPKALRMLKDGGVIALFRYNALANEGDELYDEIQTVYEKYYDSYYISNTRPVKKSRADFLKKSEIYRSYRFEDLEEYGFKDIVMKFYDGAKIYNAEEYIILLETMSDHKSLPENNRKALYAGVKDAIIKHGGKYMVNYIFQLYMGRK